MAGSRGGMRSRLSEIMAEGGRLHGWRGRGLGSLCEVVESHGQLDGAKLNGLQKGGRECGVLTADACLEKKQRSQTSDFNNTLLAAKT